MNQQQNAVDMNAVAFRLSQRIADLATEVAAAQTQAQQLADTNRSLQQRITELEGQLEQQQPDPDGDDTGSSSRPPPSQ